MKQKFLKVAGDCHFFDKHQKVLIALSGGKDSMALLECLLANRERLQVEVAIAHVNHQQRPESEQEEAYLKKMAQQEGIPIFVAYYEDTVFSEKRARDVRYSFFKKIMETQGYTALVTAHHADDQAETIFMRLLRGSRLLHLSGISPVQDFGPGQLIRPLLTFKKTELEAPFYFEDSSNQDPTYLRNRIRNDYLPRLKQENPQFSDSLLALGQENAQLLEAFQDLTREIETTKLSEFHKQTPSVQYFLLQTYLETMPDLQLSKSQFDQMLHIIRTKTNYQHYLKNDYLLIKDYEHFQIRKIIPETDEYTGEIMIESNGVFHYGSFIFSLNQPLPQASQILYLKENQPIRLRKRQEGDKIRIRGLNKKIRRYFIDQKIPLEKRNQAVIIEQDEKIFGIADIVTSDLSKRLKNDIMKATLYIKMKE